MSAAKNHWPLAEDFLYVLLEAAIFTEEAAGWRGTGQTPSCPYPPEIHEPVAGGHSPAANPCPWQVCLFIQVLVAGVYS